MILYYNPDLLFKDFDKPFVYEFKKTIAMLCKDIENSNSLSPNVIDKYRFKKMKGTEKIFKFYLDNDGHRCLVKYEEKESQVFDNQVGLILLQAVKHDDQGSIAKILDNKYIKYQQFLIDDLDDSIGDDSDFDDRYLGNQFLKADIISSSLSNEELIKMMDSSDYKSLYKLSHPQLRCLDNNRPMFIMGSAGSGKTLVLIAKALKYSNNDGRRGYFTFTKLLKETAENIYQKYKKQYPLIRNTEFHIIRDYFLDKLNLKVTDHFDYQKFCVYHKNIQRNQNNKLIVDSDPSDLWSEIRGIIKGYYGKDYYRIMEFQNNDNLVDRFLINQLLENNSIKLEAGSHSKYLIINSKLFHDIVATSYKKLQQHLINQDIEYPLIDRNSYLNMSEKYTVYTRENREKIYDFALEYQKYLDGEHLYDDNDLARMLIKKVLSSSDLSKFDFLLIDEVQDLTELQIFALTKLSSDQKSITMTGDTSQVINPNFFHEGRLGLIFKNQYDIDLETEITLSDNYRNSANIVEVVKELLKIRVNTIGKYSYDIVEESRELEKKEGLPLLVEIDDREIRDIMFSWVDQPNVAIVVSDLSTKNELKKEFKIREEKETNIYTVQEIKGQEYEKVLVYNIASNYQKEWNIIMNKEIKKGSDEALLYRFYFNLFYVAITRGRLNLFLFEKNRELAIINRIRPLFEIISSDNAPEAMNISNYNTKEQAKRQADLLFIQGDYKRAHTFYLKANSKSLAKKAKAFDKIVSGEAVEEGIIMLFNQSDCKEAYQYIDEKKYPVLKALFARRHNIDLLVEDLDKLVAENSIMLDIERYQKKYSTYFPVLLQTALRLMESIYQYRHRNKINNLRRE